MKKIAFILLILGGIFASIPKAAVSNGNRYNKCYQTPPKIDVPTNENTYIPDGNNGWRAIEKVDKITNPGWICETDGKICYLMIGHIPTLLYCESK